jgi:hypothetical protein
VVSAPPVPPHPTSEFKKAGTVPDNVIVLTPIEPPTPPAPLALLLSLAPLPAPPPSTVKLVMDDVVAGSANELNFPQFADPPR